MAIYNKIDIYFLERRDGMYSEGKKLDSNEVFQDNGDIILYVEMLQDVVSYTHTNTHKQKTLL